MHRRGFYCGHHFDEQTSGEGYAIVLIRPHRAEHRERGARSSQESGHSRQISSRPYVGWNHPSIDVTDAVKHAAYRCIGGGDLRRLASTASTRRSISPLNLAKCRFLQRACTPPHVGKLQIRAAHVSSLTRTRVVSFLRR